MAPGHIDEILALPGFKSAKNFTELEHKSSSHIEDYILRLSHKDRLLNGYVKYWQAL